MRFSNVLSIGLQGVLLANVIGVLAAPAIIQRQEEVEVPDTSVDKIDPVDDVEIPPTTIDPATYKTQQFNYDIPVPEVPAPPNSSVPLNGTLLARDGSILSIPLHGRSLSNPEIRARATVFRPGMAYFAGLNIGTYKTNGGCKSLTDWKNELTRVKRLSNKSFSFTVVKIFTTAQCGALDNALKAAKSVGGIKIWAGIWASPYSTFVADKNELGKQILGSNGYLIHGVSVGSEEMFRGTGAGTLAGYIWDVKGMIQNAYGKTNIPVGTSDSIVNLLNGGNQAVLDASDATLVTDYPYYGGVNVDQGLKAFQRDWWALGAKMGGRPLIVGETGWPSLGPQIGQAQTGTGPAGKYFRAVACWMRSTRKPFFWFEAIDEHWKPGSMAEKRFGTTWADGRVKFVMTC